MVGLKQNRSAQDEKLVAAIFNSNQQPDKTGNKQDNLIVDARPTANAVAQTALGAGSENMDNYKGSRKIYLGIDNIHVMRESLNRIVDALKDGDISSAPPNKELLYKSNWLRYISTMMEGAVIIANHIHYNFSHVLIHCSDGWDRTSQLSSLAQIMLDPYFRTLDGFMVLVEKEWLSFGHRFAERSGYLNNPRNFVEVSATSNQAGNMLRDVGNKLVKTNHLKYTSPIFHQFLDAVYQLLVQFPDRFEFSERFLRRLLYHTYSCQYGTFLCNNEAERKQYKIKESTRSVWDYFLARRSEFLNHSANYDREREFSYDSEKTVLIANPKQLKYWAELFGRTSEEMNSRIKPEQLVAATSNMIISSPGAPSSSYKEPSPSVTDTCSAVSSPTKNGSRAPSSSSGFFSRPQTSSLNNNSSSSSSNILSDMKKSSSKNESNDSVEIDKGSLSSSYSEILPNTSGSAERLSSSSYFTSTNAEKFPKQSIQSTSFNRIEFSTESDNNHSNGIKSVSLQTTTVVQGDKNDTESKNAVEKEGIDDDTDKTNTEVIEQDSSLDARKYAQFSAMTYDDDFSSYSSKKKGGLGGLF